MEQSHLETLNQSDSLFPFPPHRRRHLKSETFLTLVRILSHCHADSHTCHSHPQERPKQDVDVYAESSRLDENNEGSSFVERNLLEEVNEMQLMELEKWVSDCGGLNSLLRVTDDEEIEEGEISGDFGVYDQSMDLLFEDAVSLEKKNVDEEQNSEATINDEQLTCKKQKVANQEDTKSNKNFVETIDNVGKEVELKILSNMPEIECKSEIAVFGKYGEAKLAHGYNSVIETVRNEQQTARAIEEFNHPAVPGKISRENATKNQSTLSTEKV
ncbi:uncharacterized protein LOC114263791 [Camellia sinensis]|uniref:uncharacterized protein LOC114263791 n=1 Tax=Camellia sinensis TaxID=4442 RepID=UPI001035D669|nr:uncharacterized protein LOC114263791 [Camellia sinensis]